MTKKRFLFKMNARLISLKSTRRSEILNHYRSLVDQSIANGNSEEASIDAFGSVNTLCRLILKKEKKSVVIPILFNICNCIGFIIKAVVILAVLAALIALTAVIITAGYSITMTALTHFMPNSYLISSDMIAAAFKVGACMITGSLLIIMFIFVKTIVMGIVKIIKYIIEAFKDSVYMMQSTKLMKEAFNLEAIN